MRVRCFGLALALLGLMLGLTGEGKAHVNTNNYRSEMQQESALATQQQPPTEAKATKARVRGGGGTWRLLVVLARSQPSRLDVQRAWEEAVRELVHLDVELGWVESPQQQQQQQQNTGLGVGQAAQPSHPTALLGPFCAEVQQGKTILLLVLGGGPAARFLVAAASSMRLPSLWMPFAQRDFVRQGREGSLESRMGSGSTEMGAAAAALMHKAHWRAFNLLIEPSLMPLKDLVSGELQPRMTIYLPTEERKLSSRLRRLSEENGRGSVIVLACDLINAKKVIQLAAKYEMLAGRFLWLWLDLKAELRANEPNIIGQHVPSSARLTSPNDHTQPLRQQQQQNSESESEWRPGLEPSLHTLSSLNNELHRIQEFHWQEQFFSRRKRDTPHSHPQAQQHEQQAFVEDEDEEDERSRGSGATAGAERYLNSKSFMPLGMLALRAASVRTSYGPETLLGRGMREAAQALDRAMLETRSRYARFPEGQLRELFTPECGLQRSDRTEWLDNEVRANVSKAIAMRLRERASRVSRDKAEFQLLNLQGLGLPGNKTQLRWTKVGSVRGGREVRLDTITWPGGGIVPAYAQQGRERVGVPYYKIVTALSPPFTMLVDLQEGACMRGLICRQAGAWKCCFGYAMDLLRHVSQDLEFRFELHVARDGLFGRRRGRNGTWNGIVGELVSGKAQLAFAALSVYSHRSQVIDFTTPYYFSSVSLLIAPKERNYISLLAFLQPFSPELWIAVFTSLNITAMFVAAYEWFSPFGLNPWGRQRSKNFSIASALWVMWGLLCGHLVAFKAPKSWPNKFLINVWGGFSVIFVASYTANIAALIAGLFFHSTDNNYKSRSLLLQRVAAPKASAAEFYVQQADPRLWSYMSRFSVLDVADGVERLLNDSLDVLIADTPIIDYYRATDNGCRLEKIGDSIKEDTYAVGLSRGHPMRESISRLIANYSSTGLLDILQHKWYGGLPCAHGAATSLGFDGQPHHGGQPRPLGVASVAGVFCLLGLGMSLGVLILIGEHIFYKYSLPKLRQCPKNSIWRSRNVMFFSQKLYRFINCVELVSPHHAARELVHTVRQGQITSLFQKSVKRVGSRLSPNPLHYSQRISTGATPKSDLFQKEHEQRRRRKSKAQFFEMIQEIRRAQQEEKAAAASIAEEQSRGAIRKELTISERRSRSRSRSKSPMTPNAKSRSSSNLGPNLELATLDADARPREFTLSSSNLRARSPLELVGRRLSHGDGGSPPPTPKLNELPRPRPQRAETVASAAPAATPRRQRSPAAIRGQSFPVFASLKTVQPPPASSTTQVSRSPLLSPSSAELTSAIGRKLSREWGSGIDLAKSSEGLSPKPTEQRERQVPTPRQRRHEERPREREHRRKKSHGDEQEQAQQPVRRARSHESRDRDRDRDRSVPDEGAGRFPGQPSVGGQTVSQRAKRQLESELKAILTARAHHLELHPP